jgi:cyclophilin family peptidyl-prolyl cis-trans isomerase
MNRTVHVLAILFALLAHFSVRAGTLVYFNMFCPGAAVAFNEVDVELYNQDKPVTSANFVKLIQAGAYQNGFFHRLEPGFVLQGGGFFSANEYATAQIYPLLPLYPYSYLGTNANFGTITNEYGVGHFYSNTNWTISMAKSADPNSASSQFFFNIANNALQLDNTNNAGGFTVFGHTVRGTNVLNYFNGLSYGNGIVNLEDTYGANGYAPVFTELPTLLAGFNAPPYDWLIYYNIGVLSEQISMTNNGARQITWNAINGVTNNVEFSTNLPPNWQVLYSIVPTNATGTSISYTDTSVKKNSGYYRIHVLF